LSPGELGGVPEAAPTDIAMAVGSAAGGREHPVPAPRESAPLLVCAKQSGELRDEWDVAHRRRRDASDRDLAASGAPGRQVD
jgi:hypothetical protein